MHLAYVSSYYKPAYVYGGPVQSISSLCEQLTKEGVDLDVYTTNADGNKSLKVTLKQKIDVDGVKVLYFPRSSLFKHYFFSPSLVYTLMTRIKKYEMLILDGFWTLNTVLLSRIAKSNKIPYVLPLHGQLMPWALTQKHWKKSLFLYLLGNGCLINASGLHCSSQFEADGLKIINAQQPLFIVPYGIDTNRYINLPPRGALRSRLGIQDKHTVLLVLGRIHRVKNPVLAVQSMIALGRRDIHLVFVGPDEEDFEPRLMALAQQAGFSEQLHFTGLLFDNDLMQAFADSDLLLMPSVMESFGMAVVEALACGLPVIVSENVPIGPWIERVGAGRCVISDPRAIADVIDHLLADGIKLKKMGEQGQRAVQVEFDTLVVTKQLLRQYEAIISTGMPIREAGA